MFQVRNFYHFIARNTCGNENDDKLFHFRAPEVERSSHPVICKRRPPLSQQMPTENTYKPGYPLETTPTPYRTFRQNVDRPMWIVSGLYGLRVFARGRERGGGLNGSMHFYHEYQQGKLKPIVQRKSQRMLSKIVIG